MRIERVDDQLQQLIHFSLKFTFRHRSRSPIFKYKTGIFPTINGTGTEDSFNDAYDFEVNGKYKADTRPVEAKLTAPDFCAYFAWMVKVSFTCQAGVSTSESARRYILPSKV